MTYNYYLNKDNRRATNERAIYLYLRANSKLLMLHTGEAIPEKHWDLKAQKAKRSYTGHPELNTKLNSFLEAVKKIVRIAETEKPFISFDELKAIILKEVKGKGGFDFFETLDLYIQFKKQKVAINTLKNYQTLRKHLKAFADATKTDISLDTISLPFFDSLSNYLLSVNLSNSSIREIIIGLKCFLRWCYEREYTKNNKFEKCKNHKQTESEKIALTEEDLEKIRDCKDLTPALERVRDVFLFQTYTGQRFSDIEKFNIDDVKDNIWHFRQKKTDKAMELPLSPKALEILNKYDWKLPLISNARTNSHLKTIGRLAGLDDIVTQTKYKGAEREEVRYKKYELLTTHTARHTAVSFASNAGINQQVVKTITGHSTDKMLAKYYKGDVNVTKKVLDDLF